VRDPYTRVFGRQPRVALLWWITFLGFAHKEHVARRLQRAAQGFPRAAA
jgi:hypothetical protein